MPIHLTRIETVVNLPAPANYEPGYPVIHNGTLKAVNATQDGFDNVGGGGETSAIYGHPEQPFSAMNPITQYYYDKGFSIQTEYVATGGGVAQSMWGDTSGSWSHWTLTTGNEWRTTIDTADPSKPISSKITFDWYAPFPGTLTIDAYKASGGTCDVTGTLNGGTPSVENLASGAVTEGTNVISFDVIAGNNTIEILVDNPSASTPVKIKPRVSLAEPVRDGLLAYNEMTARFVKYHAGNALWVDVPLFNEGLAENTDYNNLSLDNAAWYIHKDGTIGTFNVVAGPGSTVWEGTWDATLLGQGAGVKGSPTGGSYNDTVIGQDSTSQFYSVVVGDTSFADEEGVVVGSNAEAGPQSVAIGSWATASRYNTLPAGPFPGAATNTGGPNEGHDVTYRARGLDTNGLPTTKWSSPRSIVSTPGDVVDVTWVQGNYPAGTTHVEVYRDELNDQTYLGSTAIATQSVTDNFSDFTPWNPTPFMAQTVDNYAYTYRGSVSLGTNSTADLVDSIALGSGCVTDAEGQAKIGADSATFVTHPGGYEGRIVSTTTTPYTVDGSGYDRVVAMDATAGVKQVDLPSAPRQGRVITVKKADSSANTVTIETPGAETIDGAGTLVLSASYEKATLMFDGTNWLTI